jgi:hypothetical protein
VCRSNFDWPILIAKKLAPTSISENEIGDRNLKPVLTQGRKENEAYKRFMTQASPRQRELLTILILCLWGVEG